MTWIWIERATLLVTLAECGVWRSWALQKGVGRITWLRTYGTFHSEQSRWSMGGNLVELGGPTCHVSCLNDGWFRG